MTKTDNLATLVAQAQKGDVESFGAVYEMMLDDVFRYIYFRVASRDAGDLTEDVFVRVWENLLRYKEKKTSSFRSWVFTIARNIIIDYYRKNKHVLSVDDITLIEEDRMDLFPDWEVEAGFNVDALTRALRQLKEEHRHVIVLRFINEFSYREIAKIVSKTETAVRIIAHRALKELKTFLDPERDI